MFFPLLATMTSASMNMGNACIFLIIVFPDMCPGVGLLDHMVVQHLVSEEHLHCFP